MTIRFAAAWGGTTPAIARTLCPSAPLGAVNDNLPIPLGTQALMAGPTAEDAASGYLPVEALRHFARHGLAAAAQARAEAEAAQAAGNAEGRDHWIAVCRQLDRRMAEACTRALVTTD